MAKQKPTPLLDKETQISKELPAASVSLKPQFCLSDATVQLILDHAPSADVAERTASRLEVDMEAGDWFALGIWLIHHQQPNLAFTKLDINDNPTIVTVLFFNPNNPLIKVREALR
jgi:hypothetical protein